MKPVFIDILEEIMGDEMTDVHRTAWNKLFNAIKSLWKQEQDSVIAQQTEASWGFDSDINSASKGYYRQRSDW